MNKRRYFVALLWHWSIPFVFGAIVAFLAMSWQMVELLPGIEQAFEHAISAHCEVK
ncbi:hypothetical protein OS670_00240 [Pseudomonadaceae bacterium T75]|nr:hypothetical protein OS670_00240 [Pseudomonadaceae bacterium T75]